MESRRKLDKDWVNQLKGVQLKYKEICESAKGLKHEGVREWVCEKEKGTRFGFGFVF